ncbi:MAG: hypothetical protein O3C28_13990 [Proteobacteria bacterium]|nr:hypothetical protein [Pseudomonadota bacterium]
MLREEHVPCDAVGKLTPRVVAALHESQGIRLLQSSRHGGYVLSGEWSYSTGTDHCAWPVLGGMVTDDDGEVPMLRQITGHPLMALS